MTATEQPPAHVDAPVGRGPTSEAVRPWRAAVLATTGAVIIGAIAYSLTPTYLIDIDLSVGGLVISMIIVALAMLMLARPGASLVLGTFTVVAGVAAFPISLGGFIAGSMLVIVGGALAAGWVPAPEGAVERLTPAGATRRAVALAVDVVLTVAVVVLLALTLLSGPMSASTAVTYLVWAAAWALLVLPTTLARGVTPGKLLLRLRVRRRDDPTVPPGRGRLLVREAVRAALIVVTVQLVLSLSPAEVLRDAMGLPLGLAPTTVWPAVGLAAALVVAAAVAGRLGVLPHDLAGASRLLRARIVAPAGSDDDADHGAAHPDDEAAGPDVVPGDAVDGDQPHPVEPAVGRAAGAAPGDGQPADAAGSARGEGGAR